MRRQVYVVVTDSVEGDSEHFHWISDDVSLTWNLLGKKPGEIGRITLDCKDAWDFKQGEEAKNA
jgi:hypothetical protein